MSEDIKVQRVLATQAFQADHHLEHRTYQNRLFIRRDGTPVLQAAWQIEKNGKVTFEWRDIPTVYEPPEDAVDANQFMVSLMDNAPRPTMTRFHDPERGRFEPTFNEFDKVTHDIAQSAHMRNPVWNEEKQQYEEKEG